MAGTCRLSLFLPALVTLAALVSACAADRSGPLTGRYFAPDGIVLGGYDPVAYFTEGRPVKGRSDLAIVHDGAEFWFASPGNRDLFEADPARYVPRYGGFCAYGLSEGHKATTEPDAFTVYDGKLYLNYNREVRTLWSEDRKGRIARADANWPRVRAEQQPPH